MRSPKSLARKRRDDPYAAVAACYGICLDPIINRWKRDALKLWPPWEGMVVLDVGCGTGAQLDIYRSYGCRVFGIELSAGMIAAARQKFQGLLNLCRGDAVRMPYRNQSFDLILLSMMLHEIADRSRYPVLAEIRRVLKGNGRILLIEYRAGQPRRSFGRLFRVLITGIEWAAGRPHFTNYRNFIKNGGLLPLLKQHRLTVERHHIVACGNIRLNLVRIDG